MGIAACAVLAAGAGLHAFREVGWRLDAIDSRIPPAMIALDLSRSAQRIIAMAPALLAATEADELDSLRARLAAESQALHTLLRELREDNGVQLPLAQIKPLVEALMASLADLDDLVGERIAAADRVAFLRSELFRVNNRLRRLLAPWLAVTQGDVFALLEGPQGNGDLDARDRQALRGRLARQQAVQRAQGEASAAVELLAEASTAESATRLPALEFRVELGLQGIEERAAALDSRLRPLFLEQVEALRRMATGANSLPAARGRELALIEQGRQQVARATRLSGQLTAAVDRLAHAVRHEVATSVQDALFVQRDSARLLVALVLLSLGVSVIVVWLYVGRRIVGRITSLSEAMRAIAEGRLQAPVESAGGDEISAMGRAVEVLRRNTLERNALLAERAKAADRLEEEVRERTGELARSVEELRALGEVTRAVNATVDLGTVLDTIVSRAVELSATEAGALYVLEKGSGQFELRATHGMDPAIIRALRRGFGGTGGNLLREAARRGEPLHISDLTTAPVGQVPEIISREGFRPLLLVPLLVGGQIVGALVVRRRRPGAFPERTVDLLQTFAAQSALAIRNARLVERLQEKSQELEVANRYKSHFLAAASHDLRQPLYALNLFVAQLQGSSDARERKRVIERVAAATDAMNELLEALLDISRLEAGVLEPNPAPFSVAPLLHRVETTFADAAQERGLRLRVVASRAVVRSDFVLLERMLFNLVANAVRYTERGGVLVGLRRHGASLRLDVYDTGPGIPPEHRSSVFGAFFRLAGTESGTGLGLGLAIVERLGRLLGHEVTLDSRPGFGTRFSIMLPRAESEAPIAVPETGSSGCDYLRDRQVVLLDDDPMVLEAMGGLLRGWGCRVWAGRALEPLLERLSAARVSPDLIVADYRLAHGQTGVAAIVQLQELAREAVPALLITADTTPERLREAAAHGYPLLYKPVGPMALRAMLNRLLAGTRASEFTTHPGVISDPAAPAQGRRP